MKKIYLAFLLTILLLNVSVVSALKIENTPIKNIVISELANTAEFDIYIDTEGVTQDLDIFTYYSGFLFEPSNLSDVSGAGTYRFKLYLPEKISRVSDDYKVEYVVNGKESQAVKDVLRVDVVEAKEVLDMSVVEVEYGSDNAKLIIKNTINQSIESLLLSTDSIFFKDEFVLDFEPLEEKVIELKLNKEEIGKLPYGDYIAEFEINNTRSIINVNVNYIEKEDSSLVKENRGLLVRKTTYTRTNTGNVPLIGEVDSSKDVFSRLFTVTSIDADNTQRNALTYDYSWSKELAPGESFSVTITTNYTLPFILILLIIFVAFFVTTYLRTNIILDKSVSYVKTRGGEFALKVRVRVKARKNVENIQIIDRLPGMTQLYEKFGIKPDKIDHASKRLFWNIDRLNAGEERVYSYVIFSKVSVVGRFELPSASADYQRDGKVEQAVSNRAFFVAETGL